MVENRRLLWKVPFFGVALYLLFVVLFSNDVADYDLWGYLSFGRVFVEWGYFPFQDIFSYTPTKPVWVYHEWLTGVLFYLIYKYSGPIGLQFLRYSVVLITLFFMYRTAVQRGATPVWSLTALIPAALLISFGYVPVRAQIFTYLFFILTLYYLEYARKTQEWLRLAWLIPVDILWCNLHGGFPAGLVLPFLYGFGEGIAGRKARPYFISGAAGALATLVNPYGADYWRFILHAVTMPRWNINEWASLYRAINENIYVVPASIFVVLAFITLFLYVFRGKRDYVEWLLVAATLYAGIKHIRHTVFFGLVFGSYLPLVLSDSWQRFQKTKFSVHKRKLSNKAWSCFPAAVLTSVFVMVYLVGNPMLACRAFPAMGLATPSPEFPAGAWKWIKENRFSGNILPNFEWGEFFIWYFSPSCRVAMDGRYETVYPEEVTGEYFDFLAGKEGGRAFLEKYPHDLVVIRPDSGGNFLMQAEKNWKKVFSDIGCVIYLREK